jgi:hypothetical protein
LRRLRASKMPPITRNNLCALTKIFRTPDSIPDTD